VEQRAINGGITRVLVDTSPDLREQLLDAKVDWLDGVLFTHAHADHTHGIDDLRPLVLHKRRRIDCYLDDPTREAVFRAFGYCFETPPNSGYPPILNAHQLSVGRPVTIEGPGGPITALPVTQGHGEIASLGFRFGHVAYSADIKTLPPETEAALAGLDCWIVDALRYEPHYSHFNVEEALGWIARIKPARAILINMHSDLDYEVLRGKLPAGVEPGFDGLSFDV
jgi:phosphoribosyl 1,2-cyclic phosphate phosphodiesterase